MRVLIIGAAGFVGGHLIDYLRTLPDVEVYATKLDNEKIACKEIPSGHITDLNILDGRETKETLTRICPDYIIHLAAQSSVSYSWKEPAKTYNINVIGTVNLLEAAVKAEITAKLLLIGSAEEYGRVKPEELPISEDTPIKPESPYALSKAFQEMTAHIYADTYRLNIVMVRAFNHIGPSQMPTFAIPAFAKQIAEIERGMRDPVLLTGNLGAKRDFTDVRDVVRAYWELVQKGRSGEVYNVGTGKSHRIGSLLNRLIDMSNMKINVRLDPEKVRPADIPELRADISKITRETCWQPQINIEKTLSDVLDYWRAKC